MSVDGNVNMHDGDRIDMAGPLRVGLVLFAVVFGVFGLWAALAPLDGAAYAPGEVTVASYSKVLQHLEGGIVAEIYVEDGDRVEADQTVMRLDRTQPESELEIVSRQVTALRAREARLMSEREGLEAVAFGQELAADSAMARAEMAAQRQLFRTRKAALGSGREILEQRVVQLQSKLEGLRAVRSSKETLATLFDEELADARALLSEGFADRNRVRDLERSAASTAGEVADLGATIAGTEIEIGEARLEIVRREREFQSEIATELADTQTRLDGLIQRKRALEDVVARTRIRSPAAGTVTSLQIHTVGAVISPGTALMEIVPRDDELIIEARVSPIDIDRVAIGQDATIRFPAFGSTVPTITGKLTRVSADSVVDDKTGVAYYLARVEVTSDGLQALGSFRLLPGMPAEVFVKTGSRTFLEYLFKPLSNAFARSFNED